MCVCVRACACACAHVTVWLCSSLCVCVCVRLRVALCFYASGSAQDLFASKFSLRMVSVQSLCVQNLPGSFLAKVLCAGFFTQVCFFAQALCVSCPSSQGKSLCAGFQRKFLCASRSRQKQQMHSSKIDLPNPKGLCECVKQVHTVLRF